MDIQQWWYRLLPATQEWLAANNGDSLDPVVVAELTQAGRPFAADPPSAHEGDDTGITLSDEEVDWIEELSNGESSA